MIFYFSMDKNKKLSYRLVKRMCALQFEHLVMKKKVNILSQLIANYDQSKLQQTIRNSLLSDLSNINNRVGQIGSQSDRNMRGLLEMQQKNISFSTQLQGLSASNQAQAGQVFDHLRNYVDTELGKQRKREEREYSDEERKQIDLRVKAMQNLLEVKLSAQISDQQRLIQDTEKKAHTMFSEMSVSLREYRDKLNHLNKRQDGLSNQVVESNLQLHQIQESAKKLQSASDNLKQQVENLQKNQKQSDDSFAQKLEIAKKQLSDLISPQQVQFDAQLLDFGLNLQRSQLQFEQLSAAISQQSGKYTETNSEIANLKTAISGFGLMIGQFVGTNFQDLQEKAAVNKVLGDLRERLECQEEKMAQISNVLVEKQKDAVLPD